MERGYHHYYNPILDYCHQRNRIYGRMPPIADLAGREEIHFVHLTEMICIVQSNNWVMNCFTFNGDCSHLPNIQKVFGGRITIVDILVRQYLLALQVLSHPSDASQIKWANCVL
jgi:hypothetical protein